MAIVITGASGHLGRRTAELLIEQVDPKEVVLASRTPDAVADLGAGEVRFANFDDPGSLDSAFAGAERVLIISSDVIGDRVAGHLSAIDAAVRAGAAHIVYTSIPNPTEGNPAPVADDHRRTEEALRAAGVAWTALRDALYVEMLAGELAAVRASGHLLHNEGDGRTSRVAREDCAAVAAAVLADPAPHADVALDVTGPSLLDAAERGAIYARFLGREVEVEFLADDAYGEALRGSGMPDEVVGVVTGFGRAIREGALSQQSDVVERLVGRPPLALEEVLGGR